MSRIETRHMWFWNGCEIWGSLLHSPLLNPDKRFALDLFGLLVSKSNIIHFTFCFPTIVGDSCRPQWCLDFDSEIETLKDALMLLFVAVISMVAVILKPAVHRVLVSRFERRYCCCFLLLLGCCCFLFLWTNPAALAWSRDGVCVRGTRPPVFLTFH